MENELIQFYAEFISIICHYDNRVVFIERHRCPLCDKTYEFYFNFYIRLTKLNCKCLPNPFRIWMNNQWTDTDDFDLVNDLVKILYWKMMAVKVNGPIGFIARTDRFISQNMF